MAGKSAPSTSKARQPGKPRQPAKAAPAATDTQGDQANPSVTASQADQASQADLSGQASQEDLANQEIPAGPGSGTDTLLVALADEDNELHQAVKATHARDDDDMPETIDGIYVRSFPPTFRRAGFTFTSDGIGIALSAITPEQLRAIQAESMLSVEFCDFLPDDTFVGAEIAGEQADSE